LPLVNIEGTLAGCLLVWLLMPCIDLGDGLAVGSGFGYYSLSSIFITQYKGPELGTVGLLANIIRELLTLLGAPLLVRLFGPLSAISSGGATSMDTTLPIITSVSGKEFVVLSIYHGFVVDFSVPFLVTFFCSL
ncbi:MAG: lysine exporter LysO family protein, partial [Muribaculaceae bacterium]|nr:lysine exporter LysO family protein [Muribaculaceae bacterium]